MILRLHKNKILSIYRRTPVYVGEHNFNSITVLLPDSIEDNLTSELSFKVHIVNNKGEYLLISPTIQNVDSVLQISVQIDKVITDKSQILNIYIEMYDGEEKIGKTNYIELFVNPLPDETERVYSYQELIDRIQELEEENNEQEETIKTIGQLIEENTNAMNRINGFQDGKSAYEIAVDNGYVGSEEEWLESLKGTDGTDGVNGVNGKDGLNGADGLSAYEIAVDNGFSGTETEWLLSLKGADGVQGAKGDKGDKGDTGEQGVKGEKGDPGATGADGYSPTATVTQTQNGATVSITDKNGTTTANISNGVNGSDYILTAQDKSDIADLVLAELPTTQGVQYGNQSN